MTDRVDDGSGAEELLRLVALYFDEVDPVPDETVSRATAYLRWRMPGADIAFLDDESADRVLVRGVDQSVGTYRFVSREQRIEMTIGADSVVGILEPWTGGRASLEFENGSILIDVDEHGAFRIARPPANPVRLRVETSEGQIVTTEWFLISRARSS
jgi:hypothetical protein